MCFLTPFLLFICIVHEYRHRCLSPPLPPLSPFLPGLLRHLSAFFFFLSLPTTRCPVRCLQTEASRGTHWTTRELCRSPWTSFPYSTWTTTKTHCTTTTRNHERRASTWRSASRCPARSMWRRSWADRVCVPFYFMLDVALCCSSADKGCCLQRNAEQLRAWMSRTQYGVFGNLLNMTKYTGNLNCGLCDYNAVLGRNRGERRQYFK